MLRWWVKHPDTMHGFLWPSYFGKRIPLYLTKLRRLLRWLPQRMERMTGVTQCMKAQHKSFCPGTKVKGPPPGSRAEGAWADIFCQRQPRVCQNRRGLGDSPIWLCACGKQQVARAAICDFRSAWHGGHVNHGKQGLTANRAGICGGRL